jgi:cytochrome c-type biogenesis protein CcmH
VIVFSIIVIALLLVVALGLTGTFPFPPRDEQASSSLRWLRWALPSAIAVIAIGVYTLAGKTDNVAVAPVVSQPAPHQSSTQQTNKGGDLDVVVKRLESKLEKDPKNGEGWALLAHTYVELGKHREADAAFAKAAVLLSPDAKFLADWADAHVVAHDRKWDDAARDMIKRALSIDPKHLKSLALAGSEAFDRGDYKNSIAYWKKMKAAAPADSMDAKLADANIQEADAILAGKKPGGATEDKTTQSKP